MLNLVSAIEHDHTLEVQPFMEAQLRLLEQIREAIWDDFRKHRILGEMEQILRSEREEWPPHFNPSDPDSKEDAWMPPTMRQTLLSAMQKHGSQDFLGTRSPVNFAQILAISKNM